MADKSNSTGKKKKETLKETLDEKIKNTTGGRRINGSLAWTRRLGGRNVAVGRYR